jgi:hypothetical protein
VRAGGFEARAAPEDDDRLRRWAFVEARDAYNAKSEMRDFLAALRDAP